jgi:hypothetical protein
MAMTNHKAVAGAVASVAAILLTRALADWFGLIPAEVAALGPAVQIVAEGIIGAAVGYAVVWLAPANRERR